MAVNHQVTILNSETAVLVGPSANHAGRDITIQNLSSTDNVYIGTQGVTSSSFGYRLLPNSAWSVELMHGDHIYAISNGTASIAVFTLGLESFN